VRVGSDSIVLARLAGPALPPCCAFPDAPPPRRSHRTAPSCTIAAWRQLTANATVPIATPMPAVDPTVFDHELEHRYVISIAKTTAAPRGNAFSRSKRRTQRRTFSTSSHLSRETVEPSETSVK
jgi:hypothetical protein